MQEGMEGNPVAGTMKNVSRGLAILTVPFTMGFPKVSFSSLAFFGMKNFPLLTLIFAFEVVLSELSVKYIASYPHVQNHVPTLLKCLGMQKLQWVAFILMCICVFVTHFQTHCTVCLLTGNFASVTCYL